MYVIFICFSQNSDNIFLFLPISVIVSKGNEPLSNRSLYIFPRSTHWMTDWLTHSIICRHNALGKAGKIILWPNSYKVLGSNLDYVLKGDMSIALKSKTVNLSTVITVRTWRDNLLLDERRKKIRTRSQAEAHLEQIC